MIGYIAAALVIGGGLVTNLARDPVTASTGLIFLLIGCGLALARVMLGVSAWVPHP